jgi:hypothetical protein
MMIRTVLRLPPAPTTSDGRGAPTAADVNASVCPGFLFATARPGHPTPFPAGILIAVDHAAR